MKKLIDFLFPILGWISFIDRENMCYPDFSDLEEYIQTKS